MSAQSFLLGRIVTLQVFATTIVTNGDGGATSTEISYDNGYTTYASVQKDGGPGFRIRGKVTQVEATVGIGTNPITLDIFNLSQNSRALIESRVGTKIAIFAGYGDNVQQIGLGNILWARSRKEGPDFITSIIAGDSHFALANGIVNLSFKGAVTYAQVINQLIDSLADQGIYAGPLTGIIDGGYNNGYVASGSPLNQIAQICQKMGAVYRLQANELSILPPGSGFQNQSILVSTDTGMIGIPEVRAPGVIGVIPETDPVSPQTNISFKTLLNPNFSVFQAIQIQSKFVNGKYILSRVVHDFDSWEGPFFSECEAFLEHTSNG